ncbi:MAG: DUF4440 domain-containing protein [Caldithrix sp.]|nr:DUF4440 domain-containing protein [Caldithrix sp.]
MKILYLVLVSFFILYAACQTSSDKLTQEDIREIRNIEQEFADAYIARDIQGMVSMRTHDIVWMPPASSIIEGKTDVRQYLTSAQAKILYFSVTPHQTEGSNSIAYNRGEFKTTFVLENDTTKENGKYLQIWRKQSDGSWLMAVEIWNTNTVQNL